MGAASDIKEHVDVCTARWREARDAATALARRVEELTLTVAKQGLVLGFAQVFLLKVGGWVFLAMATGLTGAIWWIVTHPAAQP